MYYNLSRLYKTSRVFANWTNSHRGGRARLTGWSFWLRSHVCAAERWSTAGAYLPTFIERQTCHSDIENAHINAHRYPSIVSSAFLFRARESSRVILQLHANDFNPLSHKWILNLRFNDRDRNVPKTRRARRDYLRSRSVFLTVKIQERQLDRLESLIINLLTHRLRSIAFSILFNWLSTIKVSTSMITRPFLFSIYTLFRLHD